VQLLHLLGVCVHLLLGYIIYYVDIVECIDTLGNLQAHESVVIGYLYSILRAGSMVFVVVNKLMLALEMHLLHPTISLFTAHASRKLPSQHNA
jgi:hypothetical protein